MRRFKIRTITSLFLLLLVVIAIFLRTHRSVPEVVVSFRNDVDTVKVEKEIDDEKWYNFTNVNFLFYAYSAIYDDRPSLQTDPVVRIVALSDDFAVLHKASDVYCVLHDDRGNAENVVRISGPPKKIAITKFKLLPGLLRNTERYVYSCPTISGIVPRYVSISDKTVDVRMPVKMPVYVPRKPRDRRSLAICVPISFGHVDPYRLIEWFELQRILGVSFIGVYDFDLTEESLRVFRHYVHEGFVDLRKARPIYERNDNEINGYLVTTTVLNDCMYRHMYEFDYMAMIDFDEFIVPRKHDDLHDLLADLERTAVVKKWTSFVFRNNYFFLELAPDTHQSSYFTVLRYQTKVDVSPPNFAVKSIINPRSCTHMHHHHCWGFTANYTRHGWKRGSIEPELALSQHYTTCRWKPEKCQELMGNLTHDDIMLRFKDRLTQRVRDKVRVIMKHDI